ncbi:abortive infection transcriptional regulator AbiGI [Mycoplasma sp. NEAQ87857]|uniref:type IV toxin-antitoxin system AbiEi family antitoxin domain-containing protein n=1 Tax=Mycoplasma sp. NEAQ87857 TaxID=2683967 RepID=UPI0013196707|nr:type IV toxin-antitoxin system AbiEi family antitoxin domain-containing protein [Mycoplasma sp. NEAQ87857]QGZ97573.1 abortive infection transcriptional regulator AbiGI [Mycoplasma sp. NEAQ87857]
MKVLEEYFESNAVISTQEAYNLGISSYQLNKMVKEKYLERVKKGVYKIERFFEDEFATVAFECEKVVFSHGTALWFLGYSDRIPNIYHITVPQGYNVSTIKKRCMQVVVHYVKPEVFELGKTKIKSPFGSDIYIYNAERTICDIVKNKKHMDLQIFSDGMKWYFRDRNKNMLNLYKYSDKLNIKNKVLNYVEVL